MKEETFDHEQKNYRQNFNQNEGFGILGRCEFISQYTNF